MRVRSWVTILLGIAFLSTTAVAQPRYDMRRLDVEAHFGLGAQAVGQSINDVGQYAGYVRQGFGPALPFIWNWETDTVTVIDEGVTGFFGVTILLINNQGQLADMLKDEAGITAVRLWDPVGGFQQLSTATSLFDAHTRDMNDQGEVAGGESPGLLVAEAVIWSVDGQRNLGWLSPGHSSNVEGLSESGEAVGISSGGTEPFGGAVYWSAAGEISELIGGEVAYAINTHGEIVGRGMGEHGEAVGLYWSDRIAVPAVLPCTTLDVKCFALQINDRGEILGFDDFDENDWTTIWVDGQNYRVDDLVDGLPDTERLLGFALNNRGEIGSFAGETPVVLIPQDTTRSVRIDVEPFQDPGCLEIDGLGSVPVAIFGEADFDVQQIDRPTLRFEGLLIEENQDGTLQCATEFVDADAFPDLVCQFVDEPALWTGTEPEGTLVGQMFDGTPIEGTDGICLVESGCDPDDEDEGSDDEDEGSDDCSQ